MKPDVFEEAGMKGLTLDFAASDRKTLEHLRDDLGFDIGEIEEYDQVLTGTTYHAAFHGPISMMALVRMLYGGTPFFGVSLGDAIYQYPCRADIVITLPRYEESLIEMMIEDEESEEDE